MSNCHSYPWKGREIAVKNALSAAAKARLHRVQRSSIEYKAGECSATQVERCIYKHSIRSSNPIFFNDLPHLYVRVGFFAGCGFVVAIGFFVGLVLLGIFVWLAWLVCLFFFPGLPYTYCGNVYTEKQTAPLWDTEYVTWEPATELTHAHC